MATISCPKCNLKLKSRGQLHNHYVVRHNKPTSFQCQLCSRYFINRHQLHRHEATCGRPRQIQYENEIVRPRFLAQYGPGRTDQRCRYGRIDVELDQWVVEIKKAPDWKHAIGQVLVYCTDRQGKRPWIHLYDRHTRTSVRRRRDIERICNDVLGIRVTFDDGVSYLYLSFRIFPWLHLTFPMHLLFSLQIQPIVCPTVKLASIDVLLPIPLLVLVQICFDV